MKRIVRVAGLMALLSALALQAQTPAPKPGPEHQKLNIWVGDWTFEGEAQATPLGPAGRFAGKSTVRPILNGFFVEFRGESKGPKDPGGTFRSIEVDGYDAVNKRYTWNDFGNDGSANSVTYTIDGTTVTYSGTALSGEKQYKIRGTVVFTPDFMSNVEKREVSADGQTWMPVFEGKFVKSKKGSQKAEKAK